MNGNVLVTGASGFIGTNLCLELRRMGVDFVASDLAAPRIAGIDCRRIDLLDGDAINSLVRNVSPATIFHLGARTDLHGTGEADYAANTIGLGHLVSAARKLPVPPRFISASSRLVFRIGATPADPYDYSATTPYGASKITGERLLRAIDPTALPWVIVRPTSIWGPWFDVPYRTFFDAVRSRRYLQPTGRTIRKSFGFIGNAVHQLLALAAAPAERVIGRPFFLADYTPIEVGGFADAIAGAFSVGRPRRVPVGLLRTMAIAGDMLQSCRLMAAPPLTSFRLDNLLSDMVYDLRDTQDVAGPLPFSMNQGIAATTAWMRDDAT